ncbi:MAG TPA: ATP-dependent helicase [Candidatus Pacearchaeota archaeon]|nr:ATP-dependent helicase [Candidatus Pacearchaeota archaeon]
MQTKIDYKKELNDSQYKAATFLNGPVLVIAGAGSGKTRTLIFRVAYLIEQGIDPDNILLLTFTRKASQEMLRRAGELLDDRCLKIPGGTFHSFANNLLRKYAQAIGFSNNFSILDEQDSENLLKQIRNQLFPDQKDMPKKNTLRELFSFHKNKETNLEDIIFDQLPQFKDKIDQIKEIFDAYSSLKLKNSMMDYDDLLIYCKKLLENNISIRKKVSDQYRYIMIDEYQDTNKIQSEIAELLAGERKNIMAVGDDSQSIYSFRGADFKNIMDFPKRFPGTEIITLETNYRSTQQILDLTNKVIEKAKEKYSKNLKAFKGKGPKPIYAEFSSEREQAKFIIEKLKSLEKPLGESAVLFRSSWHSNELELELIKNNISFVKYGGIKFVESAHTKDILSFLRVDFSYKDSAAWQRILSLHKGIGLKTAQKIIDVIIEENNIDILDKYKLGKLLKTLIDVAKETEPEKKMKIVFNHYKPILKERYLDDFDKREKDLQSLQEISSRYQDLQKFLSDTLIESPDNNDFTRTSDRLVLSTIHSAKGLEWNNVFLINLVDGFMPSLKSLDNLEEERRLFYVALTRAKNNLFLMKPDIRPRVWQENVLQKDFSIACRFLDKDIMQNDYLQKMLMPAKKKSYLNIDFANYKPKIQKKKGYLDFDYTEEDSNFPKKSREDDDIQYINDW